MTTLHLIANAHLDPVWLWDWREGLNEGLSTCRAILNLMDEDPALTFIRGEAAIYEHIERTDPVLFARIAAYVASGRWDVVGGTYIQPDTNLPATETLIRQFTRGKSYFASRFGVDVTVAWAADSFGHGAGLPQILASAGMRGFAYTRPGSPVSSPAFWWQGPDGSRVLAYCPPTGWYGAERDELPGRLDALLRIASEGGPENVGVFYGVGNHGGGPTRRQLADIAAWMAAHPAVHVIHSGLHQLFDALYAEVAAQGEDSLPVYQGELNYCLRGCYSSIAKLKYLYRRTEAAVSRAERTATLIGALAPAMPPSLASASIARDTRSAWDAVLFNAFHDILPGSSIERAMDEQIAWLGGAMHMSLGVEFDALNTLAAQIDTSVTPAVGDAPTGIAFLVWNPHPFPYNGPIEMEGALDARPIWPYANRPDDLPVELLGPDRQPVAFQRMACEHSSLPGLPWRIRALTQANLPPLGWAVYELAYREGAVVVVADDVDVLASAPEPGVLDNGILRVEAHTGGSGIAITRKGEPLLGEGGLSAVTVEDPWGSWGAMDEAPESLRLDTVRDRWVITRVETMEAGPNRASLWIRMLGGSSVLDLTVTLTRGRDAVDFDARVLWNERSARLKLVLPVGGNGTAEYDTPGASVTRGPDGEVPGGRWVRAGGVGFASDGLYNFDCADGVLRATVVRASRYGADETFGPKVAPWRPAVDRGELRLRFLIAAGDDALPQKALILEQPPVVLPVPAKPGTGNRRGSFGSLTPAGLSLLAIKPAEDGDGCLIRIQNRTGTDQQAHLHWGNTDIPLGTIQAGKIASWRLTGLPSDGWQAKKTNSLT